MSQHLVMTESVRGITQEFALCICKQGRLRLVVSLCSLAWVFILFLQTFRVHTLELLWASRVIRLCRCTGWSEPVQVTYVISTIMHAQAHIIIFGVIISQCYVTENWPLDPWKVIYQNLRFTLFFTLSSRKRISWSCLWTSNWLSCLSC